VSRFVEGNSNAVAGDRHQFFWGADVAGGPGRDPRCPIGVRTQPARSGDRNTSRGIKQKSLEGIFSSLPRRAGASAAVEIGAGSDPTAGVWAHPALLTWCLTARDCRSADAAALQPRGEEQGGP
jgi:hypothetical protein